MNKYEEIAKQVVEHVGGISNVEALTNCMTRLRFTLKDLNKADVKKLEAVKGVQGVVNKNGQFQVVIGSDVSHVCDEIKKMGSFSDTIQTKTEHVSVINRVLGAITAIFQPVIPAICGAGMLKAVLALLTALSWISTESQTYVLLNMFADAAFYFLPIYLAFSSAKYFKCNPYIAAVLGAILIHPTFSGLVAAAEPVTYFGIPVKLVSYGSSVVPPILIVWLQSYVEKFANKVSPNAVKVFLAPLIEFFILCPICLIVIGPLGSVVGDVLYVVFDFLNNQARWVIPVLMGAFCPLFVMTGMHYSFMPVQLAQYATLGYGTLLGPGMLASNISQAGACFAVALRTKNKELRSTAISAGTTALFGITEPALYGVTMRLKTPLWCVMVSGGIAGLWGGLVNMRTYASATAGITALPVYITDDMMNVVNAVICIIIALVCSFVLTLIFGMGRKNKADKNFEEAKQAEGANSQSNSVNTYSSIYSPLNGKLVKLENVNDDVFSKKVMGSGIAIFPESGKVCAPFDGKVNTVFPTKHAIGLTSDEGIELIIHVGLDTVELNGEGFVQHVQDNQEVKKGDLLLEVDLDFIQKKGYDITTPIIVTNSSSYIDVIETDKTQIKIGEECIKVFK